ncbi:hypothetical protein SKAU_G00317520, partial [Synaphobranchus kaupii]
MRRSTSWTHFLPTWYFLYKLLTVVLMLDAWRDVFTWPLLVFLVSACVYPLASSCAHTFSSMSARARHVCFFFDYGALSFYSLGSAITYSAYVIPDKWVNSTFHLWYIPIAVFNTIVCTALACYSRLGLPFLQYNHDTIKRMRAQLCLVKTKRESLESEQRANQIPSEHRFPECQSPKFGRVLRILAFAYPYLFDNIPVFYRIFVCTGEGCTDNENNALHYRHTALAFLTAFLFSTHLPERLAPGCFDYIGHSHQLFHVCGIIGTHFQ